MNARSLFAAMLATAAFSALAQVNPQPTTPADAPGNANTAIMKEDRNKDGVVSKKEASAQTRAHWAQWDRNQDGVIDATEYAMSAPAEPGGDRH